MRSFSELVERIRYNPLPRLFINALKRIGIVVLPYYVFRHDLVPLQCPELDRAGTRLVELQEADMAGIAALPMANSTERAFRERLRQGNRCFGLELHGELVSYCWMSTGRVKVNGEYLDLGPDEAYAFDIYTRPDRRGSNLAPLLNSVFNDMLYASGVRTVMSTVDYYNYPSLRFAAKVGARRHQLRLYLRLFGLWERSFLLKPLPEAEDAG